MLFNDRDQTPEASHLIAECVPSDGDGLRPAWNQPGNVLADDRLTEDRASQDVPDGAVGALPHLLQLELFTYLRKKRHPNVQKGAAIRSVVCEQESGACSSPSTLASSGVMVAHLTATLYFFVARAESMVTWSSV